jgi:hypothetical protein
MTASISTANKNRLNHMNRAAQNVNLGTMIQNMGVVSTGSWTVTAAQASASRVDIATGLASVGGFMLAARRSGSPLHLAAYSGSVPGTLIAIKDPTVTGSAIATGDIVSFVAFQ